MAKFKGHSINSVDSKGRIAIPAKMRGVLNPAAKGSFTITRGFENCIFLYPLDEWEKREEEFEKLNMYERKSRDFLRSVMMWAEEVSLDAQGRIGIPKSLGEFAMITDKVRIMGSLDHIEIWAPDVFKKYMDGQLVDYETLAESVMGK